MIRSHCFRSAIVRYQLLALLCVAGPSPVLADPLLSTIGGGIIGAAVGGTQGALVGGSLGYMGGMAADEARPQRAASDEAFEAEIRRRDNAVDQYNQQQLDKRKTR